MRMKILGFLVLVSTISRAQNYVDILSSEYTISPSNKFQNSEVSTTLEKINMNATVPIKLKNGNAALTGMVYDLVQAQIFESGVVENFSAYTIKMGYNAIYANNWSATYLFLPKLAATWGNNFGADALQLGGLIIFKKQKNKFLNYKYGLYANSDRFGPFLVPLIGGYYQYKKVEIDAMVPSFAKINYAISSKLTIGVNWRATVKSYTRMGANSSPTYMHHLSNEVGAHLGLEPIKGIIIRGVTGFSAARSLRVYDEADKIDLGISMVRIGDNRIPMNTDFENGLFFRMELGYRLYLD